MPGSGRRPARRRGRNQAFLFDIKNSDTHIGRSNRKQFNMFSENGLWTVDGCFCGAQECDVYTGSRDRPVPWTHWYNIIWRCQRTILITLTLCIPAVFILHNAWNFQLQWMRGRGQRAKHSRANAHTNTLLPFFLLKRKIDENKKLGNIFSRFLVFIIAAEHVHCSDISNWCHFY